MSVVFLVARRYAAPRAVCRCDPHCGDSCNSRKNLRLYVLEDVSSASVVHPVLSIFWLDRLGLLPSLWTASNSLTFYITWTGLLRYLPEYASLAEN